MDLPEQVIEQPAENAPASEDKRSYVRDDGTLVINILVEPPCGESTEGEIVVCAPGSSEHRPNAPEPPVEQEFKPEVELAEGAKVVLRAETDPWTNADRAMIDLKITF